MIYLFIECSLMIGIFRDQWLVLSSTGFLVKYLALFLIYNYLKCLQYSQDLVNEMLLTHQYLFFQLYYPEASDSCKYFLSPKFPMDYFQDFDVYGQFQSFRHTRKACHLILCFTDLIVILLTQVSCKFVFIIQINLFI